MGAKHGIMFKTAVSLEETGKTQIIALDKTGTITSGKPEVTDMVPVEGISEEELLSIAYALERRVNIRLLMQFYKKQKRRRFMTILKLKTFWRLREMGFLEKLIKRRSMVETRDLLRNMQKFHYR